MRQCFFILFFSFLLNQSTLAQHKVYLSEAFDDQVIKALAPFYSVPEGGVKDLLKGEVVSEGKVDSPAPKEQQLMLFVAGIHPRNCTRAMRKLSLYENYNQYMDFVKQSSYNDETQKISLMIDHTLLPFPMILSFKIPRIKGEGHYPFVFEDGFLKNLKGTVGVKAIGKYCLLSLKTDWRGPETKIPNIVFSTFLQTVGKLGLEHLIRVSLF